MTTLTAVPDDTDGPRYSAPEAAALANVSYRCVFHWTRCGYVGDQPARVGSGNARTYNLDDVELLRLAGALIANHLHPQAAFDMARAAIAAGEHTVVLADIYQLTLHVRDTTKETT